jgi:EF-hand domain-containing protein 1
VLNSNNITLTYQAYFEERPIDASAAGTQVRKCNIYFFMEDGSLKIVEKPQLNSGVSQGTLVRRTVIAKPDGSPITEHDLVVGETLTVYGRHYK